MNWWRNLSVSHKLYGVVGIMAILIAFELFTLLFAMNTLSAVRAFVGGEGLWSKAQKDAVLELENYAFSQDEKHYEAFLRQLQIPAGDHDARMEMERPNMNLDIVKEGFVRGHLHPNDIEGMAMLIRRFSSNPYIAHTILVWRAADENLFRLTDTAKDLRRAIQAPDGPGKKQAIHDQLENIFAINDKLTNLENDFSSTLGEASRWLEGTLMLLLIIAVATVESTGVLMTITFSRGLARVLNELHSFATDVGSGNLSKTVPVRSGDELGRLARALNNMAADLKNLSSEKQVAERANEIKSLFLANMSHEIRTPLNAILGFVDLLKDPNLGHKDRIRYVEIIERTGNSLATIINDILDLSKVEAGKLEIEKAACSPVQILDDLRAVFELRCQEKGISLKFQSQALPNFIKTDALRYKQILINMIGNAVKFTSKGQVTVQFERNGSLLQCLISDTGAGIATENVNKLFQPFSQVDLSIRKEFGGTGLGLILSRRLAQLLGGDVTLLSSEVGRGSVFSVTIPAEEAAAPKPKKIRNLLVDSTAALRGKRILIVEDSIDNQLLAQQFLEMEGAEVALVNHGQEAIEATGKQHYDLVLMDMQMPVLDGYEATALLRQQGYQTPIIALTANAMKEDLDRCLAAGCDDYLCKPFRRAGLISIVLQHCPSVA